MTDKHSAKVLSYIILGSMLIRGFLAWKLEFGNDEVYYRTYALFPDLSHFDHPPMVGFMIQLFTLDLLFDHEFFIRLSSIVFGAVNTYLIYRIGVQFKDRRTGLIAALLYNTSFYCFVIAGVFILPDTPQLLFWLLGLYLMINLLPKQKLLRKDHLKMILLGILIGLGMLSKYTSVFLWFAILSFALINNRKWFRYYSLYLAIVFSALVFLPVIIWNIQNGFISFTFQGQRIDPSGSMINLGSFVRELSGQIFYNNPVNFVLIVIGLLSINGIKKTVQKDRLRILLYSALPLIIIFLLFSLFRPTLPHWAGPGYTGLIVIASAWWSGYSEKKGRIFPLVLQIPVYFLLLVLLAGYLQINYGLLFHDKNDDITRYGKNDVTLDMYGWKQAGVKFADLYQKELQKGAAVQPSVIISHRWFPAANIDYYIARPLGLKVLAMGDLDNIHKYEWINRYRGGFTNGMNAWYITSSRDYKNPADYYSGSFEKIIPLDTIPIVRGGRTAQYFFIYRLEKLKK